MRFYRYLLFFVPIAGLVLLTGALRNPFAAVPDEPEPLPAEMARLFDAPEHPGATAAVNQAIADVSDPARPWLQTDVHVRCLIPELRFTATGTFLRAPGQRFRLEVRTRLDDVDISPAAEATVLAVSDGNDLWQATLTGKQEYRDVQRLRLGDIYRATDSFTRLTSVREKLVTGPGIRGPEHMLRAIYRLVSWVHLKEGTGERTVIGVWQPGVKPCLVPKDKPWPAHLPRLCRLTLQGARQWPARLQWWGPTVESGPDYLLAEIEFKSPIRDQVMPDDHCARLFSFDPGSAYVHDTTSEIRSQVDPRP